jgi:glycosyltransferase involved in cell wall biosynthesis
MREWAENNLNQILAVLKAHPEFTPEAAHELMDNPDPAQAMRGFIMAAAMRHEAEDHAGAMDLIGRAASRFGVLPIPLFVLQLAIRYLAGEDRKVPSDFLDYGCRAVAAGQDDLGTEAIGTAFVEDADRWLDLVYRMDQVRRAAAAYEQVATRLRPQVPPRASRPAGEPLRVGLLVANLVDDVVAYSKRVLDFVRYLDPAQYRCFVYSSENMCFRQRFLPTRCFAQPSEVWAPKTLAELERRGVPVFLASRSTPTGATAVSIARRLAEDAVDILVFQSGPGMPIDWLASRLAPVPAKIHIHIGAATCQPGLNLTVYDNAVNMEREKAFWPSDAGEVLFLRQGTDLDALDALPTAARPDFDLPERAVLIGVLSNHLDKRLSPAYLDVIGEVLQRHAAAWFVAIGGEGLPPAAREHLEGFGVLERVRSIPSQREPGRVLKMLDIYANEFPVGGSQAVVEAMACGLPVAALRSDTTHVGSTGADIVGPPYAVESPDPAAYGRLLERWVVDAGARRAAGAALRRRAEQEFSIRDYVRRVAGLGADLARGAQPSLPG